MWCKILFFISDLKKQTVSIHLTDCRKEKDLSDEDETKNLGKSDGNDDNDSAHENISSGRCTRASRYLSRQYGTAAANGLSSSLFIDCISNKHIKMK